MRGSGIAFALLVASGLAGCEMGTECTPLFHETFESMPNPGWDVSGGSTLDMSTDRAPSLRLEGGEAVSMAQDWATDRGLELSVAVALPDDSDCPAGISTAYLRVYAGTGALLGSVEIERMQDIEGCATRLVHRVGTTRVTEKLHHGEARGDFWTYTFKVNADGTAAWLRDGAVITAEEEYPFNHTNLQLRMAATELPAHFDDVTVAACHY